LSQILTQKILQIMRKLTFLVAFAALITAHQMMAQNRPDLVKQIEAKGSFEPMFPFQPTHNAPDNITNVRTWAGVDNRPAGIDGFVSTDGEHFVDENGNVLRFLGTQCGMTGCFPSHAQADKLAKEFTRYGINIVRMHYVSHRTPKQYPVLDSFIEPVQLEKFDYFIAKLKENGIYVYFQLNIARKFSAINGIMNPGRLPKYKNGVDNVNRRMIDLQKRFHKEILEHVNPYTGIAYKDETCISMMEIANENSIVHSWFSPTHKFSALVEPYKSEFIQKWNEYLLKKYGSTEALKAAWITTTPDDGKEILSNANNDPYMASWRVQKAGGADAEVQFRKSLKRDGMKNPQYLRLKVLSNTKNKVEPRLYQTRMAIKKDCPYCLKFKVRSDSPMSIIVKLHMDHAPWKDAGLKVTAKSDYEWKEYKYNFTAPYSDDNVKLVFNNFMPGIVDIADISLSVGLDYDWPENQSLEAGNVDWPYNYNWSVLNQKAVDFVDFMSELEEAYFPEMYDNIKTNLGVKQPVTGTQLGYGLNQAQTGMDYCDMHCYWCHPAFPGGKWDNNHFNVRNEAIINSWGYPASTFANVARSRMLGKPFTVSEFDIPNLNFYCAEANLMMSALGAFQDWGGLIQFSWILDTDFDRQHVWPQFDMCSAPQKLVHFPACHAMFVRGDVRRADDKVVFARPSVKANDVKKIAEKRSSGAPSTDDMLFMNSLPLVMKSGVNVTEAPELFQAEGKTVITRRADVPSDIVEDYKNKHLTSSTGELTWDWQMPGAGYFMVDTRNTKVFSGFVRGRSFTYRGMTLTPGKTRLDWLTLSLTLAAAKEGSKPGNLLRPGSYLLAATGMVQNTDMKIVEVAPKPQKISISEPDGGKLGTGPVLCEGIPATLSFAGLSGRVKCFALDPDGNRTQEVAVGSSPAGEAVLEIGPQYKTVWYELIVE